MAVPDYQSLMRTVLSVLSDGIALPSKDIRKAVAQALSLSEEDQALLLGSGKQTRFANRVAWACFYMAQAGLLARPARGKYSITARGLEALKERSTVVDNDYLRRFPEFVAWVGGSQEPQVSDASKATPIDDDQTPEETIKAASSQLQDALASQLLTRIMESSPRFFEILVVDLLVAMGYGGGRVGSAQVTGRSGDGGIDGIINEDRLGLSKVLIQAKRWKLDSKVSRPDLQQFAGALQGRKGIFITTSSFTKEARDFASSGHYAIVLIDGAQLTRYMIDHGVGVNVEETIKIMKMDEDYFAEE